MSGTPKPAVDPNLPAFMQKIVAGGAAVSRRQFMKLGGIVGGGLVIGLTLGAGAMKPGSKRLLTAEGDFVPNAYVQVRPDGEIVLYAKNPEIGQGVKTSLPMIVAEELDADWSRVRVEQSAISEELFGEQFAGGSLSVPRNWDTLRRAGAVARAMLVAAAAEQLEVDAAGLVTEAGFVIHEASGRKLGYGELAQRAAMVPMPDPEDVPLKDRKQFRLLGRRITGVDNHAVVTGKPLFGIDQRLPGMLYAAYVKAPAIGARAVSANLAQVKSLPGVKDAFLLETAGTPVEFDTSGAGMLSGVAIVADSTWAAFKAADLLEVEWDESEASSDSWREAVAEAGRLAARSPQQVLGETGDVDAAFAQGGKTVEAFYSYPYLAHADLEPQNCTAWCKDDGSVEIWAPTQTPQGAVEGAAAFLGVRKNKVLLHQLRAGGGFGRRLANDSVIQAVAISKRVGAPVQALWRREDDMRFDYYRPGGFHAFRAALDGEGRLAAFEDHFITFTRDGRKPVTSGSLKADEFPASVLPNARMAQSLIASKLPTGPWRAPGSNAIAFAIQGFLHECAVAAGRDHVEFLLEVMGEPRWLKEGDLWSLNTGRAAGVIRLAAEKAGWGRKLPKGRGLGLAFHFSHAGHIAEVADVSVDENRKLTVHKVTVAADIGPIVNLSGAENQAEGSVVDGFSAALGLQVTFENGRAEQSNFDRYPLLRMPHAPPVEVHYVDSDFPPTGSGEPVLPPVAPAICNAIYAACGHRVRSLPLVNEGFRV